MKVAYVLFCLASSFLSVEAHPFSAGSHNHAVIARKHSARAESVEHEARALPTTNCTTPPPQDKHNCFPALGFQPPANTPSTSLSNWWCPASSENGFLGFSYGSDGCQSYNTLLADFTRMRTQFNSRYVRMYSWCDRGSSYYNDVVNAAYHAGIGVYLTIWFGFDGGDSWKGRRDALLNVIHSNSLAPYVVRSIDVGSEPLFDWALDPYGLADAINYIKSQVSSKGIQVSISEMQYGYTVQGDSQVVLNAQDVIHAHELAFFDADASYGSNAWPSIASSVSWFVSQTGNSKKVIFTQTGWPTNANIWPPNSPNAVASVDSAKAFAQLLDRSCEGLKAMTPQGGVGWFWHIWKDEMLDGWGLLDWNENPKWNFAPRTQC